MRVLALVVGLLASAVCLGDLRIEAGFVQALIPGQSATVAYFTVENSSDVDCYLVGANADFADRAEIHSHRHQSGMSMMRAEASLPVPALGRLSLAPGGYHLMLFGVNSLTPSAPPVNLQLDFGACGERQVSLPVRDRFHADGTDNEENSH